MKKIILILLGVLTLNETISASQNTLDKKQNKPLQNSQQNLISDPFAHDPFFQSSKNILDQMHQLQKTIDQLMEDHFSQMRNNIGGNYGQQPFGSDKNVEVIENNNELIYKVKLPQGTDSKVDVSVKNNNLVLNLNVIQKITHEHHHSKSVSYSQSSYSQSFQLPSGYDTKSMDSKIKDSNLIVRFKKLH